MECICRTLPDSEVNQLRQEHWPVINAVREKWPIPVNGRPAVHISLAFAHTPNAHAGRVAQLIQEAERRGQAGTIERARDASIYLAFKKGHQIWCPKKVIA